MSQNQGMGPYRFDLPDDGLAIYREGQVLEQYLACDEYWWWQKLRVGNKTFKFPAYAHTTEEQKVKVWKSFRDLTTVERPMEGAVNLERPKFGEFQLTWLSVSELRQAKRILEAEGAGDYDIYIQAIGSALKREGKSDEKAKGSSWYVHTVLGKAYNVANVLI
ncbi:hypothetical protein N8T08_009133 [Aspergillus melleus]|uniref:Uncharacterized protein n=1 Tax=Aspergillus melleus TaxID=138277 RepID=A0ACC3AUD3_9EURO|nr:hypothetical protein N8T08_009133 [Aspergillus melleus]